MRNLLLFIRFIVGIFLFIPIISFGQSYKSVHELAGSTFRDNFSPYSIGSSNFEQIPLFNFPGYTFPEVNQIKVYIPAGTRRMFINASLPQATPAVASLQLDSPPTGQNPTPINNELILSGLLAGQNIVVQHDGSGTYTLVWGYSGGLGYVNSTPTTKGHWLYINFTEPAALYQFQGAIYVDSTIYAANYKKLTFASNGDPIEGGSNQAFVGCRGGSVSWGNGCTATVPDTAFGQSVSVKNTAFGLNGTIAGQCTATAGWSNVALDCTPAVFCKGGAITWGNDNQCAVVIPDTLSGEYVYKANGTSGFAGYVTGQCTGTTWTNIGFACNAITPSTTSTTGGASTTATTTATAGSTASTATNTATTNTGGGATNTNPTTPTTTATTNTTASGDLWGCEVLLCLSNPNGPMAVSECVPPIQRLYAAIFKLHPDPFPTCNMAVSADGSRSYATPVYDYIYDDCPSNTTTIPDGYLVMQGTRGNIPNPVNEAWVKKGIGDGSTYRKQADSDLRQKVCGGGAYFETTVTTGGGDGMNSYPVGVYERLTFLDPRKNNFAIKVFINDQLWRVVTP